MASISSGPICSLIPITNFLTISLCFRTSSGGSSVLPRVAWRQQWGGGGSSPFCFQTGLAEDLMFSVTLSHSSPILSNFTQEFMVPPLAAPCPTQPSLTTLGTHWQGLANSSLPGSVLLDSTNLYPATNLVQLLGVSISHLLCDHGQVKQLCTKSDAFTVHCHHPLTR